MYKNIDLKRLSEICSINFLVLKSTFEIQNQISSQFGMCNLDANYSRIRWIHTRFHIAVRNSRTLDFIFFQNVARSTFWPSHQLMSIRNKYFLDLVGAVWTAMTQGILWWHTTYSKLTTIFIIFECPKNRLLNSGFKRPKPIDLRSRIGGSYFYHSISQCFNRWSKRAYRFRENSTRSRR